jgi:hypothetical protein
MCLPYYLEGNPASKTGSSNAPWRMSLLGILGGETLMAVEPCQFRRIHSKGFSDTRGSKDEIIVHTYTDGQFFGRSPVDTIDRPSVIKIQGTSIEQIGFAPEL